MHSNASNRLAGESEHHLHTITSDSAISLIPPLHLPHDASARTLHEASCSSPVVGARAAQQYFRISSLKDASGEETAGDPHCASSSAAPSPTTRGECGAECSTNNSSNGDGHAGDLHRRDVVSSGSDHGCASVVRLTSEEEQEVRLHSYNVMAGGKAAEDTGEGADEVTVATRRDFVSDTVHTIFPSAVTSWLSRSANTVVQTSSSAVPDNVKSVASAVASSIGVSVEHIGSAIDMLPDAMVKAIPPTVMSEDVKQLLFTDFSNTFRSFFHTNILSMPFVFRQAGLAGGILLLSLVAVTSEYATEAFFSAKNQMREAHKVVVYGDVPLMIWGDWYPTINIFYGATHLIGFIAFSSSNAVVLLSAMGMTGGGARALGIIMPSLIALPLVFMKSAHSQKPLAIMSNTLVLISVGLMCAEFRYQMQSSIKLWPKSPAELFVALGVTVYAFTGIGSAISVERVVTPRRYRVLLRLSVAISGSLLMAFGLSGFLSYGNQTCSVLTVSLHAGPLRTAASALLFFASLTIIPQQTFPLCEISDRRVLGIRRLTHYWDLKPNLMRVACLVLSAFAAFIVPYYGLILSISGSLGCGIVGLVVPAALDYVRRERWALREGRTLRFWEYCVVFGLGLYGCMVVVVGVGSGSYELWRSIQTSSTDNC